MRKIRKNIFLYLIFVLAVQINAAYAGCVAVRGNSAERWVIHWSDYSEKRIDTKSGSKLFRLRGLLNGTPDFRSNKIVVSNSVPVTEFFYRDGTQFYYKNLNNQVSRGGDIIDLTCNGAVSSQWLKNHGFPANY